MKTRVSLDVLFSLLIAAGVSGQPTIRAVEGGEQNGPATEAVLSSFGGVAVDSEGNLCFGDESHRIRKIDADGWMTIVVGISETGKMDTLAPLPLETPLRGTAGVASLSDGKLLIADSFNHRSLAGSGVVEFSGDGGAATERGSICRSPLRPTVRRMSSPPTRGIGVSAGSMSRGLFRVVGNEDVPAPGRSPRNRRF